jgi:hypothetical protein
VARTCATVAPGARTQASAAVPATCGVAIDVPESSAHEPPV